MGTIFDKAINKFKNWLQQFTRDTPIFESVSTVVIQATKKRFVAKKKFVVNTKRNAQVKISAVWGSFTAWFLWGKGKIEGPNSQHTLHCHKLLKTSFDDQIIAKLGGEAKVVTTLSEIFSLMKKQGNGEDGVLLNDGRDNIFYVRYRKGMLRAVNVCWGDGGWRVGSCYVRHPRGRSAGSQVFSRNPIK